MIAVPPLLVLAALELLLLLGLLTGWLFWRLRRGQRAAVPGPDPDAASERAPAGGRAQGVRLDVGNYLGEELERTRARLHHPVAGEAEPSHDGDPPRPAAWLALRADYLQVELDFANHEHRDDAAWATLGERLEALLKGRAGAAPAPAADTDSEHDSDRLKDLLKDQVSHIDDLQGFLKEVVVHPEKAKELEQRIGRMTRLNQELAGCVAVLEGENDRLWRELETARGASPAGVSAASAAPATAPAPAGPADASPKEVPEDAPDAASDVPDTATDVAQQESGGGGAGAAPEAPPPPPKSPV